MPRTREDTYQDALQRARGDLRRLDPFRAAYLAGCSYTAQPQGRFDLTFFGSEYAIAFPDAQVRTASASEPDVSTQILLLHYLIHADGTPPADHWISFRELPDGRIYDAAFQGRSPVRVARVLGHDLDGFVSACRALKGEAIRFGDAAYRFQILPRVAMAVILHLGDDEFPATGNVVFDGAAGHYLPTEDYAVLGGMLASKIVSVATQRVSVATQRVSAATQRRDPVGQRSNPAQQAGGEG
ncbi:MAG: hypothetical protein BWY10_00798 [Chloroflexi bacterium ADurb.Bin180]|nr:MAG: hypothetical protein BWY10_00798 [Chloroflexi bacterium ADurb.Bin180]